VGILSIVLLGAWLCQAKGTDVRFSGTVTKVELTSVNQGTVTFRIITHDIPIQVNADTEIESHGDPIELESINVGDFAKVSGFFSTSGIVAEHIQILDDDNGEFRLRGVISNVARTQSATTITLLGVNVIVDSSAKIERRGPRGGFSVEDLAAGLTVDVRGTQENGILLAKRVKVGNRADDEARVGFDGRITMIQNDRIMVDTAGGGVATVLTTSSTRIKGSLAVGRMVDIRGTLNAALEVVAEKIIVEGHNGDDDDEESSKFKKEIRLSPTSNDSRMKGEAEIEWEEKRGRIEQEFEVEIEKAQRNTEFRIQVELSTGGTIDFGTFRTNGDGKGEVEFSSEPKKDERDIRPFLPTGTDVRDFRKVLVTDSAGVVILQGRF
jgi:hypothetical protein